jgi:hypothetical protein
MGVCAVPQMLGRRPSEVQGKVVQAMGRWPLRHQSSEDLWHLMGLSFCNGGGFFGVFGGGALAGEAGMELGQGPTPPINRLGRPLESCAGTVAADECFGAYIGRGL